MAVSSTQAKPGRKWRLRKQIRAQRWCNEDRTVLPGHYVHAVVNVLIAVIDDRDFDGQGSNAFPAFQSSGQVCLEAESIAEAKVGVERGYALHSLIADKGAATDLETSHLPPPL